ncbi:unnamed protein product [Closterium sp. NIES-53]
MPGSGGTHRDQHPQTSHAQRTTHEATGTTGSHEGAAAAGAGHRQSLPAAQRHPDQHQRHRHPHHLRRRHLHPHCRCLRRLHLHRRYRSPHSRLHLHHRYRSPHSRHHPHLPTATPDLNEDVERQQ